MSNDAALGDYIGSLIAEVSRARMQVDMEAKNMALLYKEDPLLQHFPIPRFRIPEMEIEGSVFISSVKPGGKPDAKVTNTKNLDVLKGKILGRLSNKFRSRLFNRVKTEANFKKISLATDETIQSLEAKLYDAVELRGAPAIPVRAIRKKVKLIISKEVGAYMKASSAIGINALSSTLKEHARDENGQGSLLKIKMKITEESYQWSVVEGDDPEGDDSEDMLVPE